VFSRPHRGLRARLGRLREGEPGGGVVHERDDRVPVAARLVRKTARAGRCSAVEALPEPPRIGRDHCRAAAIGSSALNHRSPWRRNTHTSRVAYSVARSSRVESEQPDERQRDSSAAPQATATTTIGTLPVRPGLTQLDQHAQVFLVREAADVQHDYGVVAARDSGARSDTHKRGGRNGGFTPLPTEPRPDPQRTTRPGSPPPSEVTRAER